MSREFDLRLLAGNHIALLERQHRAGIPPSFGQIEDLFDYGRRLRADAEAEAGVTPCSLPSCTTPANDVVHGLAYCGRHARALLAVSHQVEADIPRIARDRVQAMELGKTPWPTPEAA